MSNSSITKKIAASMMAFSLWAPNTWWSQPPVVPTLPPGYPCVPGGYCCTPFKRGCENLRPNPPTPTPLPQQPPCLLGSPGCCPGGNCNPAPTYTPLPRLPRGPVCLLGSPNCCTGGVCGPSVPIPPIQPIQPTPPARPGVYCIEIYSPVCGVDGHTYGNSCYAEQIHNVPIAHLGECHTAPAPIVPSHLPPPYPRPTYIEQFNTPHFTTECDPHASVCIPIPAVGRIY